MFNRNLKFLLDFYKETVSKLSRGSAGARRGAAARREALENYRTVSRALKKFASAYLPKRSSSVGQEAEADADIKSIGSVGSAEVFGFSDSSDAENYASKGKKKSKKSALAALELQELQQAKAEARAARTKTARGLATEFIESIINRKLLQFTVSFMLWRYRQYEYFLLSGVTVHKKLGDIMRKQQDVRLKLPGLRLQLQEYDKLLFAGTE